MKVVILTGWTGLTVQKRLESSGICPKAVTGRQVREVQVRLSGEGTREKESGASLSPHPLNPQLSDPGAKSSEGSVGSWGLSRAPCSVQYILLFMPSPGCGTLTESCPPLGIRVSMCTKATFQVPQRWCSNQGRIL